MASDEFIRFGNNHAVLNADIRSKSTKPFDMLINRTKSDIAALWKGDGRMMILSEKCSDQIIRAADLFHRFVDNRDIVNLGTVDFECVPVGFSYNGTDTPDRTQDSAYVADIRHILNDGCFICHDGRGKNRKRSILCSRNSYFSDQGITALD